MLIARRSSDGSVSPVMDRVLSMRSPNSFHFVGRRSTKFSSHKRYLKGFVSGDSRARKVAGAQDIPIAIDRKTLVGLSPGLWHLTTRLAQLGCGRVRHQP